MASSSSSSSIIRIHAQNFDGHRRKAHIVFVGGHPVAEVLPDAAIITQPTCVFIVPATQWRLVEVVEKAIIAFCPALPKDQEGRLAAGRALVGDTEHRFDGKLHFGVGFGLRGGQGREQHE